MHLFCVVLINVVCTRVRACSRCAPLGASGSHRQFWVGECWTLGHRWYRLFRLATVLLLVLGCACQCLLEALPGDGCLRLPIIEESLRWIIWLFVILWGLLLQMLQLGHVMLMLLLSCVGLLLLGLPLCEEQTLRPHLLLLVGLLLRLELRGSWGPCRVVICIRLLLALVSRPVQPCWHIHDPNYILFFGAICLAEDGCLRLSLLALALAARHWCIICFGELLPERRCFLLLLVI